MSEKMLLHIPTNVVQSLRKQYNLDGPGRMEEAINILENWINQQNHILKKDFNKEYLERVLIVSKGSVEKSKKHIDTVCTMRTLTPILFCINNTKEEFQEVFKHVKLVPLPVPTEDFYRIIIFKISYSAFSHEQLLMVLQYYVLMTDYLSRHDYVNGFVIVNDFQGLNILEFVSKLAAVEIQQCLSIITKGYGARVKSIHIFSQSKVVDLFANFAQAISPKIANRMCVFKSSDDFFSNWPINIFPIDYGGNEKDLNTLSNDWFETLFSEENLIYYNHMKTAHTDESLRSSEKFNNEYLGMPGSFRKLTVD